ncbi:MAG: DUF5107 domain-containing protein [Nocardioidaceae bacterium]
MRDPSTLSVTTLRVPCAPIGEQDPIPLLDRTLESSFVLGNDLPEHIREGASFGTPRSLHPYLIQNRYNRDRIVTDMDCIVLENEHLRARFLPQLGGRLWSLVDLATGHELLYQNEVIQPANLALRNAWFAGGVEWNIATKGHSPHTASPVHGARVTGPDGVPTLRFWEFERLRRVVFQVDVRLPPGSRALHVYVRIQNPNAEAVPMYWWSNAAVPAREHVRVLAPATRAFTTAYDETVHAVTVPVHESTDQTWPGRSQYAADYFFDLSHRPRPWIAAVDPSGHGLGQVSTDLLAGRKLFCWGTRAGGRRWQDWLSPEGGSYLEIQAGLAATQFEHVTMPARAHWSWLEAYGDVAADPTIAHGDDWQGAIDHVDDRMDQLISPSAMTMAYEQATALADVAPTAILCQASGWGALERESRTQTGEGWVDETGSPFATETMGPDQDVWRQLLSENPSNKAALFHADPLTPPASYVIGDEWASRLGRSPSSWARDYHLGVLAHATGDLAAAHEWYSASLAQQPTAWALRGQGRIAAEQGDHQTAADLLMAAAALAGHEPSVVIEAITAALAVDDGSGALELIEAAPVPLRDLGRMRLLEVQAALASGDRDRAAKALATAAVVPDIREGETSLSDLWLQLRPAEPIPAEFDFRMR